jgi:NADH-quinone oxidoreductase subunit I
MGHYFQAMKSVGTTLKNALRKPTTSLYPEVIRPRGERYRVAFALTHDEHGEENCIACKLCSLICPSEIITVTPGEKRDSPVTGKKRGYLEDFTLDMNACIYCELCVQVCPTDAIVMTRQPEKPAFAREDLVMTMDKLYANEKSKPLSWSNGTRLCDVQDPARPVTTLQAKAEASVPEPAPTAQPAPPTAEVP